MDVSQFMGGNYFSQTDLLQPVALMTIGKVDQQLVGQGQQADQRICITFNEFPQKPLALNKTNLRRVAALYGVQAEGWQGKQLQVYRSTTTFGSETRLCVRVCGPQQAPPDPIVDPQGVPVMYQPPAAQQPQQPAAQPVAQQPVQPAASQQPPAQPAAAPAPQQQQQQPVQAPVAAPQPASDVPWDA